MFRGTQVFFSAKISRTTGETKVQLAALITTWGFSSAIKKQNSAEQRNNMAKISLYVVGIHFRQTFDVVPDDPTLPVPGYVTGAEILEHAAKQYGLRYKLSTVPPGAVKGHINYVSYTPNRQHDPAPRVTFPLTTPPPKVFPFYGQPLSLTEILAPIGQASQVLQYTAGSIDKTKPTPKLLVGGAAPPDFISPMNDGTSSFGITGFPDGTEIRIRSLNIYCTY